MTEQIPSAICAVVGEVIGSHYFNHTRLDILLAEHGAPGDPPPGNCVNKVTEWLKIASRDQQVDALAVLGGVIRDFMETDAPFYTDDNRQRGKQRIEHILGRYGMSYQQGGHIAVPGRTAPVQTLEKALRSRDLGALEREHQRALQNVASDPEAAVTAACSLLESLFKVYIADEKLPLPSDQSIKPLWRVVQQHIGWDTATADDDIKRVLGAMSTLVDGIGSLRTHAGSAHGHGRATYKLQGRHATLAVNASYTLATFVIQTWNQRSVGDVLLQDLRGEHGRAGQ
jgi:hypothetical protein